jgi:hypothetical protein
VNITLPLSEMTTKEKLMTMETLWENLCQNSDALPAPPWHGSILSERDNRVAEGKEQIYDWSEAKKSIRDSI